MLRGKMISGRAPNPSGPAPARSARCPLDGAREKPVKCAVSPPRPTGAEAPSMAKAPPSIRPSSTSSQGSSQTKNSSRPNLRPATSIADVEPNGCDMASAPAACTSTPKASFPTSAHRHRFAQRQRHACHRERRDLRRRRLCGVRNGHASRLVSPGGDACGKGRGQAAFACETHSRVRKAFVSDTSATRRRWGRNRSSGDDDGGSSSKDRRCRDRKRKCGRIHSESNLRCLHTATHGRGDVSPPTDFVFDADVAHLDSLSVPVHARSRDRCMAHVDDLAVDGRTGRCRPCCCPTATPGLRRCGESRQVAVGPRTCEAARSRDRRRL